MIKSKTKSISSLGAFSNFSKTARSIYNFLKIPAYLFCYGAWAQKESAKLQNMRACTGKTGLSSMKLVWLIQIAGNRWMIGRLKGLCQLESMRSEVMHITFKCQNSIVFNAWLSPWCCLSRPRLRFREVNKRNGFR